MKVYTRSGDKGKTSAIGRPRLMKNSPRIEAYGEVDELNSLIGLIISQLDTEQEMFKKLADELVEIQHLLFDVGTDLANLEKDFPLRITADAAKWLENQIDWYTEKTPAIEKFILPGGNPLASWLHYARAVCRKVERRIVTLMEQEEINTHAYVFINRLSDYLFMIARYTNTQKSETEVFYRNSDHVFKN
ncbi:MULTISPECIES: cob(I)yrinic acid a,c-diamide adenosyltransferase [Enterococcus]|uniref:Corrinoid adenosyltransferase n=1 Tax=Candidatus Enterococcus murrayae TaxID=2815321 RepID=A0ABS3HLS8_9ENTE|nr:cob(I)yrinic acid a,c-diamide adenosyltransferase [Enterococcus sp. MJM16]MBO0454405.1 cob(I)yrinic acid a,c-diamide adenosyltransferase [Enterococcus sp. MJM16]